MANTNNSRLPDWMNLLNNPSSAFNPQSTPQGLASDVNNRFMSRPNEGLMFSGNGQTYSGGATGGAGTFDTPRSESSYWDSDAMYQGMLKQMQTLPVGSKEREALRMKMENYRTSKFSAAAPMQSVAAPKSPPSTPAAATPPAAPATTPPAAAAAAAPPTAPPAAAPSGIPPQFGSKASPSVSAPNQNQPTAASSGGNQTAGSPPAGAGNGLWDSLKEVMQLIQDHDASRRPGTQTDEWNSVSRQLHARLVYLNKEIAKSAQKKSNEETKTKNKANAEAVAVAEQAKQTAAKAEQIKAQATQDKVHGMTVENARVETEKDDVMKKAGALLADGDITQEEFDLLTQNPARAAPTIARMWAQKYKLNASGQDPMGNTPGATPEQNQATKTWNKFEAPPAPPAPAAPPVASVEPPPAAYGQKNSGRYDRYKQGKPFDPSTIPYDQNTTPGAHPNYSAYG